ncbi:MAG TPA: hypothetical protein VLF66_07235 [Thermoanaerobaculia bacterium]|nr:hypothetical protein [Thermoanaerobaculia bacterium]
MRGTSLVFRETFLRDRFTAARRDTVRRFGEVLEELTGEATLMLPTVRRFHRLLALAVDLGHVAELLEDPRGDVEPQHLRQAVRWADRLREVEAEIRQALGGEGGAS